MKSLPGRRQPHAKLGAAPSIHLDAVARQTKAIFFADLFDRRFFSDGTLVSGDGPKIVSLLFSGRNKNPTATRIATANSLCINSNCYFVCQQPCVVGPKEMADPLRVVVEPYSPPAPPPMFSTVSRITHGTASGCNCNPA